MSTTIHAIRASVAIVGVIALLVVLLYPPHPTVVTRAGAEAALNRLTEWAKWMSGIQTAVLGTLGIMSKDHPQAVRSSPAIATVIIMGAALFCSAWILSSLANITLRLTEVQVQALRTPDAELASARADHEPTDVDSRFDIYEQRLYEPGGFWKGLRVPTLNYAVTLMHWLWGAGLLSFGWFLITAFTTCE